MKYLTLLVPFMLIGCASMSQDYTAQQEILKNYHKAKVDLAIVQEAHNATSEKLAAAKVAYDNAKAEMEAVKW